MEMDSIETIIDRFYFMLHCQLMAKLPKPGIAPYSKGAMIAGFTTSKTNDGWKITISEGIDYGAYAMGFDDDGNKRTPRGPNEMRNFKIIEECIRSVSKAIALPTGGKVVIKI